MQDLWSKESQSLLHRFRQASSKLELKQSASSVENLETVPVMSSLSCRTPNVMPPQSVLFGTTKILVSDVADHYHSARAVLDFTLNLVKRLGLNICPSTYQVIDISPDKANVFGSVNYNLMVSE